MTERSELLTATDETIDDAVRHADPMVLRGLLYQLTGDESIAATESGTVTIACGFDERLTQQHGLVHGGLLASLVDVACGYAALSVMPADREVLTVEFKINFLKPAKADGVIAVGHVVQAGRTLTVCEGTVFDATRQRVLARMTATMMAVDAPSS
jgi:uncharacterized protein (TIGR00369 family)